MIVKWKNKIIGIVMTVLLLFALGKGFMLDSGADVLRPSGVQALAWEKISEESGILRYSCKLPDKAEGKQIIEIKNYWANITLYLEEQEIYSYSDLYGEKGAFVQWIELPEHINGKTLYLESTSSEVSVDIVLQRSAIGTRDELFVRFFRDNIYAALFGIIALCISCGILLYRAFRRYKTEEYYGIEYLGLLLLFAGIWIITDSQILRMFTDKTALISLVSFLSFMAMPMFALLFVNEIMIYRRRVLDNLCWLYLAYMFVSILMYLLHIAPLFSTIIVEHILIMVSLFFLIRCALKEVRVYENKEMRAILTGLVILAIFCIFAIIVFYCSPGYDYPYLYCIGILLFMLCMLSASVSRFHYYVELGNSATIYQNMAYTDSMTGMENRSSFEKEQEEQRHTNKEIFYIVFDINNLKEVNDKYGHLAGDRLIIDAAACISETFKEGAKCYRIGGDEFVVSGRWNGIEKHKQKLKLLEKNIALKNLSREIPVALAYGCMYGSGDRDKLFAEADAKMYRKKYEMKHQEAIAGD